MNKASFPVMIIFMTLTTALFGQSNGFPRNAFEFEEIDNRLIQTRDEARKKARVFSPEAVLATRLEGLTKSIVAFSAAHPDELKGVPTAFAQMCDVVKEHELFVQLGMRAKALIQKDQKRIFAATTELVAAMDPVPSTPEREAVIEKVMEFSRLLADEGQTVSIVELGKK